MPTNPMDWIALFRDGGIGIAALVILFYFIRSRAATDANTSDQFKQVIVMLADSMKREDSETAKIIAPLVQIVGMAKTSVDQNTQAFVQQTSYRAELLGATRELATLQSENNTQVAALRMDMQRMPAAIDRVDTNILGVVNGFGSLDEKIRLILKAVENNPADHRHVLEALSNLATAQTKIFTLIDSRLPASAKTITPPLPSHAPGHFAPPSADLINIKRDTNQFKAIAPDDEPPEAA